MAKIEILIPGELIVQAYKKGMEDMFVLMSNFDELESELNVNKIDQSEEDAA